MPEENPNAFKNLINADVVKKMASAFHKQYPSFNQKRFLKYIEELQSLELKARVLLLRDALEIELPKDFKKADVILNKVLKSGELSGFQLWPISEFISKFGTQDYEHSFKTMYLLTQYFTSEFAIRPFLHKDHVKCLKILSRWTQDKNVHVRRWISEGTRPILPWGGKVAAFISDPQLTLPLLEKLKFDEELYVRKSVANHLNDISKNHPELVVKVLDQWNKDAPQEHQNKIQWITRHALRVLIKKGYPGALKLMGVGAKCELKFHQLKIKEQKYRTGEVLEFEFSISSTAKKNQKLIIDYVIDFVKANGKHSPKVFKLKTFELAAGERVTLSKKHPLRKITTMTFFKGEHLLSIQINGKIFKTASWHFHP
jgi:3-methyladenine DNA glycosylase AlkC